MTRQFKKYILFLLFSAILVSCSRQQPRKLDQESQFLLMISKSDINTQSALTPEVWTRSLIIIFNRINESIHYFYSRL